MTLVYLAKHPHMSGTTSIQVVCDGTDVFILILSCYTTHFPDSVIVMMPFSDNEGLISIGETAA